MPTFHARRLPHYHAIGRPIFITWRLYGSLPSNRNFPQSGASGKAFGAINRLLETTTKGPHYLRQPEIASMVVESLRPRDPGHYQLHNFVVMPNHVHILITPRASVSQTMQSLKRFTAREANRIARHIEMNPVHAGVKTEPTQFRWSSAGADYQSAAG